MSAGGGEATRIGVSDAGPTLRVWTRVVSTPLSCTLPPVPAAADIEFVRAPANGAQVVFATGASSVTDPSVRSSRLAWSASSKVPGLSASES
jgi:hypothetical protein